MSWIERMLRLSQAAPVHGAARPRRLRWGQEPDRPGRPERPGRWRPGQFHLVALGRAGLPADARVEDCTLTRFYERQHQIDPTTGEWQITLQVHDDNYGDWGYEDEGRMERTTARPSGSTRRSPAPATRLRSGGGRSEDHVRLVRQRRGRRAAGVRPNEAPTRALVLGLGRSRSLGCGSGNDTTAPTPGRRPMIPGPPRAGRRACRAATCWSRSTARSRDSSSPSANPDGTVIGLYRFEATTLTLDALQTFEFAPLYRRQDRRRGSTTRASSSRPARSMRAHCHSPSARRSTATRSPASCSRTWSRSSTTSTATGRPTRRSGSAANSCHTKQPKRWLN